MRITCFPIGPLPTNCYVLDNGHEALAIDVGGDPAPVLAFLEKEKLLLLSILVTHMHFDHLFGVHTLQQALKAPCLVPGGDRVLEGDEVCRGGLWGLPEVPAFNSQDLPDPADLPDGFLGIGAFRFRVLATPGHSPGAVAFYFPDAEALFAGDTLFYHSVGRTDLTGGDEAALVRSVREELFVLPETTKVFPGHGPETSIGAEKPVFGRMYPGC